MTVAELVPPSTHEVGVRELGFRQGSSRRRGLGFVSGARSKE